MQCAIFFIYNVFMNYSEILLDDLNHEQLKNLVGVNNTNIKLIGELFKVDLIFRGNRLLIDCDHDAFNSFSDYIEVIISYVKENTFIDENIIVQTYNNLKNNNDITWQNKIILYSQSGKPIKYKTYNQFLLAKAIEKNDLIFSIGPAGTGKTYLAVALACLAYKNEEVKKIILTRPAVEAGESLGFLPGDLKEKIDPYLMPLYDSLYDILGQEQVEKMIEKNIIEVIPLAYMRGRTLNNAYIILDEAQNTTGSQMLMFLTRLGYNSKMIVNGDITQIDLKIDKNKSGLVYANKLLQDTNKIAFVHFNKSDVVRNPLVEKIIEKFVI